MQVTLKQNSNREDNSQSEPERRGRENSIDLEYRSRARPVREGAFFVLRFVGIRDILIRKIVVRH
jgi:hypothetical protein